MASPWLDTVTTWPQTPAGPLALLPLATPVLLYGAAALTSVPIIIHLLNRRRYQVLDWAAMEFLLESLKQTRRRLQLEELLLLLLRVLMLVLLGLAMAKPLLEALTPDAGAVLDPQAAARRSDHILILDDTASTGQIQGRQIVFETVQSNARAILTGLAKPEYRLDTVTILRVSACGSSRDEPSEKPVNQGSLDSSPNAASGPGTSPPTVAGGNPGGVAKPADKAAMTYNAEAEFVTIQEPDDLTPLLSAVDALRVSDASGRLDTALQVAREIAARGVNPNKRVYVLSDLRAQDFGRGPGQHGQRLRDVLAAWDARTTRVLVQDVAGEDSRNVGISRFVSRDATIIAGTQTTLHVTLRNYNPLARVAAGEVTVNLLDAAGNPLSEPRPLSRDLAPAGTFKTQTDNPGSTQRLDEVTETFELPLDQPGPNRLMATIDLRGDTLPADNRAYLTVEALDNLPVLLVYDQDSSNQARKSTYHIAEAIDRSASDAVRQAAARAAGRAGALRLTGIRADQRGPWGLAGDGEVTGQAKPLAGLAAYRVVMLGDVARLEDRAGPRGATQRLVRQLETYVADGGSLVMFLGERVDPRFYNETLYRDGQGLMPVKLDRLIRETEQGRQWVVTEPQHPMLRAFAGLSPAATLVTSPTLLDVRGYWSVAREAPTPAGTRVLATLTDPAGSPVWLERPFGRGRVIIYLSGVDGTISNWHVNNPSFPIVLFDLVKYLAPTATAATDNLRVGQTITAEIANLPADRDVILAGPATVGSPSTSPGDARRPTARPGEFVELGRVPASAFSQPPPTGTGPAPSQAPPTTRTTVTIDFPFRDAAGVRHAARAGFYKLDWSAPGARPPSTPDAPTAPATFWITDRNFDPAESDLTRADKVAELFSDLKAPDGKSLVRFQTALDPNTGQASTASPGALDPTAATNNDDGPREDLPLFYTLMAALLGLMLVEQLAAYRFSHHEG